MGDTDTCLSLRGLAGVLLSENGCLVPDSNPDPLAAFISLLPVLGFFHLQLSQRLSVYNANFHLLSLTMTYWPSSDSMPVLFPLMSFTQFPFDDPKTHLLSI